MPLMSYLFRVTFSTRHSLPLKQQTSTTNFYSDYTARHTLALSSPPAITTLRGIWLRPREFLRMGRIHVVGLASEPTECVITLPSEKPSVAIAAVPYLSENELSHISFETEPERAERYRERLKEFYRQCVEVYAAGASQDFDGASLCSRWTLWETRNGISKSVGRQRCRVSDFPDDVTYVALGHLHRPHAISGSSYPVQYAGSPLPLQIQRSSTTPRRCICWMFQPPVMWG